MRERLLAGPMGDSGLFDGAAIGRLIDQHEQGRSDHAVPLWLLLTFEGCLNSIAAVSTPVARAATVAASTDAAPVVATEATLAEMV